FDGNHAGHNKKYTRGDSQEQFTYTEEGTAAKSESERNLIVDGKSGNSLLKQPLIGGLMKEGLKKLDSFDRWVTNELEDVNESHIQHTSVSYWDTVEAEDGVSDSSIAPQEQ
ncbi:hypothetical protein, partial [Salmonella sp. s58078]|uniref:hypothetical protein n=1 Tax=Salmonella sp. s58078 TaxID=3159699 RepID=UPI00398138AE